ncbi:MAG: hypothetical protein KF788_15020 [Piscinibacter sp.]|nr:hypothetical protein [Piscinibacter sp.]
MLRATPPVPAAARERKGGDVLAGLGLIRPRRRDLFLLLCLVGVIPAFVTNGLPTTTWLPGVEGFRWAWIDLGGMRWVFVAILVAACAVGRSLRPRWLWLAAVPLLVLVLTPAQRIGGAESPLHWVEAIHVPEDPVLDAERAVIDRLAAPAGPIDRALAHLPPALPELSGLQAQWKPLNDQALAARAYRDAVVERIGRRHHELASRGRETTSDPADEETQKFLHSWARQSAPPAAPLWELRLSLGLHELWHADKRARWVEAPYVLASSLLLLAIVFALGVGHRVTLAFLGLALLTSVVATAHRVTGEGWLPALTGLQPVCVGTLALLVLRVLLRGWLDNREIWRSTPGPALRRALLWSLVLWSPFALVLAANFWAGAAVSRFAEAHVYCQSLDLESCVDPKDALVHDSDPARDTLREDLHVAVARLSAAFEAAAIREARGAMATVKDLGQALRTGVGKAYDEAVKRSIYEYPGVPGRAECGLFQLMGCFRNIAVDAVDSAYRRQRERLAQALDERLRDTMASAQRTTGASALTLESAVRGQSAAATRMTREQADAVLVALAGAAAFGNAALLFVAARAFLLVLARLLFAQNKQAFMTITPRERPLDELAEPVRVDVPDGDELHMQLHRGRLLMKQAFDVDGAAPNTLWLPPQPLKAALSRLRHGCYWLKEIEADDEPRTLTLKSTPGTNFFCWHIPADAEVAFRWDRFAGMSGSVRLRRVFSLKLGTLVLGHVTVATARGPGLLVQHAYTRASAQRTSVSQARVVGWQVGSLFRVESGKSKKNVYVDHCHVVCAEPGLAVHEAAREGRGGHGLWRELLGLLRP